MTSPAVRARRLGEKSPPTDSRSVAGSSHGPSIGISPTRIARAASTVGSAVSGVTGSSRASLIPKRMTAHANRRVARRSP